MINCLRVVDSFLLVRLALLSKTFDFVRNDLPVSGTLIAETVYLCVYFLVIDGGISFL